MKPTTILKNSETAKSDLLAVLEEKILNIWSELAQATPLQLESLIKSRGLKHPIGKLSLIKLYQITSYRNVRNIILVESQRRGQTVNQIVNELVSYYRSDAIQHGTQSTMKEIQELVMKLLREMLIC